MDHSVTNYADSSLLEVNLRRSHAEVAQIHQTSLDLPDSTPKYLGGHLQDYLYNGFFTESENPQFDKMDVSYDSKSGEHLITLHQKENLNFKNDQLAEGTYDDISDENEVKIHSECLEFTVDFDEFSRRIDDTDNSHVVASEDYLVDFLQYKMDKGRFEDVIKALKQISCVTDPRFLQFWDEAHYMLHQQFTDGELTSLQKHRIRKRNDPPAGICIGGKRPTLRMSESARAVLRGWYKEHAADPYPSRRKKRELSERAGITLNQVNTWFSNARRKRRHRRRQFFNLTKPSNVASIAKNECTISKNEPLLSETFKTNQNNSIQRQSQIHHRISRSTKDDNNNNNDQLSMLFNAPTNTPIHAGESVTHPRQPLVWQTATPNTYHYRSPNQILGGGILDRTGVPTANTLDESPYLCRGSMVERSLGINFPFQDADTRNAVEHGTCTQSMLHPSSALECCPSAAIKSLLSLRRLCDTLEDSVISPTDFAMGIHFNQFDHGSENDKYNRTEKIQTGVSMETFCTPTTVSRTHVTSSMSQLPSPMTTISSSVMPDTLPLAPIAPSVMTAFTPGTFVPDLDLSLSSRVPLKPFTPATMTHPSCLTSARLAGISVAFPTASSTLRTTDQLPWNAAQSTCIPAACPTAAFTLRTTDQLPWNATPSSSLSAALPKVSSSPSMKIDSLLWTAEPSTGISATLPTVSPTASRRTVLLSWNAAPSSSISVALPTVSPTLSTPLRRTDQLRLTQIPSSRVAFSSPMSSNTSLSTSGLSSSPQWTRILGNSTRPCFANIANRPPINVGWPTEMSDLYLCSEYPVNAHDVTSSKNRMLHDRARNLDQYIGKATTFTCDSMTTLPCVYHEDSSEYQTQDHTNKNQVDLSLIQASYGTMVGEAVQGLLNLSSQESDISQ